MDLKASLSGQVIVPEDKQYEAVRNTIVAKGSPAIVVQPQNNEDIAKAIKYAVDNKLKLSVRSGGHSVAGFSTNDGGLVIDLSTMNKVDIIDKDKRLVRIQAGAKWGDVATTLQTHNLAISSGDTKSVGVGGLTVGGGIGWMVRKYGLAIDNLVAADLVLADGTTVRASASENPDLFFAIRGGGGNFGIVTAFEFSAQPVKNVHTGMIMYKLENIDTFLTGWRDAVAKADEALTTIVNILPNFMGNPPMLIQTICYASDDEAAAKTAIDPLLTIGTVENNTIAIKPYSEVLEEAHPPEGMKVFVSNILVEELSDELIATITQAFKDKPEMILQVRSIGGALNKVPADVTAFAYRSSQFMLLSPTFLAPDADEAATKEALRPWETIAKFGHGAYSGFKSTATPDVIADLYPQTTLDRLKTVKQKYDPQNVFNQNYNIAP